MTNALDERANARPLPSNRRAFLRAAGAVAAAPAASELAAVGHPDAELLAMQPENDAANRAWEVCAQRLNDAQGIYHAMRPKKSHVLDPLPFNSVSEALNAFDRDRESVRALLDERDRALAEKEAAWKEEDSRASDESGQTAAYAAQDAAEGVRLEICDRIAGWPPVTVSAPEILK
jgi:hypothetical protein